MIVCVCRVLGEGTIRAQIDAGAFSVEELAAACGAGTECGGCRAMLERMIEEAGAPVCGDA